ncbi:hypothetical protein [Streptomyces sp. 13-12-16]|uniref:hypothetical protein n=1 Tax=Streptomyces sp. 13-12-16 TaxID=1570823 RepID=UPI000D1B94E5|nr:hypothetical protein [Streptomyces sp. 13-12-16]
MIDQLRRDLDQADSWLKYREVLKEFRELYGPPFRKLNPYAREQMGISHPPSTTVFVELTGTDAKAPDWAQVSLMVKICVLWAGEHHEDMTGIREYLDEIHSLWKDAFLRLGGRLPQSPSATASPSRWRAGYDRIRRLPKKLTVPLVVLLVAGLGLGGYALASMDRDNGKAVEAAEATPKSGPSGDTATPSSPTASTSAPPSPTGSTATNETASGGSTGVTDAGATGTAAGGNSADGASRGTDSSGTASGGTSDNGGTNSSGGGTIQTQPYVDAKIAWSNDVDGNPDPEDPNAIVKVYDTYKTDVTATSVHAYHRTDSIQVKCQVTGGRVIRLGDQYKGPTPHRDGIWYLMDTGEWAPAVYVDTGKPNLPACAAS